MTALNQQTKMSCLLMSYDAKVHCWIGSRAHTLGPSMLWPFSQSVN